MRYLLLLFVVGYLLTGLAVVGPDERAVVRRFGRVTARPGPGLWVGLPWGIDRVDRLPVRATRQVAVGATADDESAGLFLTGDQNLVAAGLVVEFTADPADEALDDFWLHRDRADAVVGRIAEGLAAEWLAGRGVDEALLTGRAVLPVWVADRLPGRLAPHRLGIAGLRVSVEQLAAPAEVREAFDAVTRAQAGVVTSENEATQQADRRRQEAATMRFKVEQQAAAERSALASAAAADAAAFLGRLASHRQAGPDALAGLWWAEVGTALANLRAGGRVDLLDHRLGPDGLDVTSFVRPVGSDPKPANRP